jgi:outer membrane lipoprotein-sorting protein
MLFVGRFLLAPRGVTFMRRVFLLVALLCLPALASAQTVDDIVSKYIEARGGLAKIKAVQSERVKGTIIFAPTVQGPFLVERERPNKMHMEVSLGGQTLIRVYDGKSAGWTYDPFSQNPGVQPMGENDLRNILEEADFEGPFIDSKAKGNTLEYAGKTSVEGKPAYKIKMTNKNGDVSYFSFDAATYMLVRWQGTRKSGDKEVPSESIFRNFTEVDGLLYPFLIESSTPDTGQSQRILADKIEVNINISESHFGRPVAPPSADDSATPSTPATPAQPAAPPKPN